MTPTPLEVDARPPSRRARLGRASRALDARLLAFQDRLPDGRRALRGVGVVQLLLLFVGAILTVAFLVILLVGVRDYRLAQDLSDGGVVLTAGAVEEDLSTGGRTGSGKTRTNLRATVTPVDGPRAGQPVQVRLEGYDEQLPDSSVDGRGPRPATRPYQSPLEVVVDPADPTIGMAQQDLDAHLSGDRLRDSAVAGIVAAAFLLAGTAAQGVRVLRRRARARTA